MQIEAYLELAVNIAEKAGGEILSVYETNFEVEEKLDKTPLTLADKRSNELITNELKKTGIPILSEEGKNIPYDVRKSWRCFWLVDPLDGTKEFIKRNGEFTVNIALVCGGKPVLGVVHIPVKKLTYFASSERGAFRKSEGEIVKLPLERKGDGIYLVGSRSHAGEKLGVFIKKLEEKFKVNFTSAGSSLKFCLIAEGSADIYPRLSPTMEWDTCAGQAVVESSGGVVLNIETGEEISYNKEKLVNPFFVSFSPFVSDEVKKQVVSELKKLI